MPKVRFCAKFAQIDALSLNKAASLPCKAASLPNEDASTAGEDASSTFKTASLPVVDASSTCKTASLHGNEASLPDQSAALPTLQTVRSAARNPSLLSQGFLPSVGMTATSAKLHPKPPVLFLQRDEFYYICLPFWKIRYSH